MSPATDLLSPAADVIAAPAPPLDEPRRGEDVFGYIHRVQWVPSIVVLYRSCSAPPTRIRKVTSRRGWRRPTKRRAPTPAAAREHHHRALHAHPIYQDEVVASRDAQVDPRSRRGIEPWTLGALAGFLLDRARGARSRASCPGCRATSSRAPSS